MKGKVTRSNDSFAGLGEPLVQGSRERSAAPGPVQPFDFRFEILGKGSIVALRQSLRCLLRTSGYVPILTPRPRFQIIVASRAPIEHGDPVNGLLKTVLKRAGDPIVFIFGLNLYRDLFPVKNSNPCHSSIPKLTLFSPACRISLSATIRHDTHLESRTRDPKMFFHGDRIVHLPEPERRIFTSGTVLSLWSVCPNSPLVGSLPSLLPRTPPKRTHRFC